MKVTVFHAESGEASLGVVDEFARTKDDSTASALFDIHSLDEQAQSAAKTASLDFERIFLFVFA